MALASHTYGNVISKNCSVFLFQITYFSYTESGSSAVECRTRNQVSPGSNPPLLPFRRLGIFVLFIDAPVDSAVQMSTLL